MSAEIPSIDTAAAAKQEASRREWPKGILPILILAAVFAVAMTWQWYDNRSQVSELQHELARRLAEAEAFSKESRYLAGETSEASRRTEAKVGVLEAKLSESQSQQLALEALYQELTRNRDEVTLEEVEQLLLIANQQLQLANNVKAALIALQEADVRLQRIDRPQLTPIRKILSLDMDLLKTAPYVDTVGISLRLDHLAREVDKLPLAMELRPQETKPSPGEPDTENVWLRFAREIWEDIKQLVRVQNMNKPDVALLPPSQAYFVRENLRLRLLSARHALLARNPASFKADIEASLDWTNRYFDTSSEPVSSMLETLRELRDSDVGVELPLISASLDAIRKYRLARDRGK